MSGQNELEARLHVAVEAAKAAGAQTLERFRSRAFDVERKADGSEVTEADRDAEKLLRRLVRDAFPDDALLGEEFEEEAGSSGYRWIFDPIDGTRSFVHGVPLYGTLVAVERHEDEHSVIGVIHMPALDETVWAAEGQGGWRQVCGGDVRPARVSSVDRPDEAMLCITAMDYFMETGRTASFLELAGRVRCTRGWSDCYAHLLVATGRADIVIEPVISVWDVAPMIPIMREAGGRFTDWRGTETARGGDGVGTNGRLHGAMLAFLHEHVADR